MKALPRFAWLVVLVTGVALTGCAAVGSTGMTDKASRDAAKTNTQLGVRYLKRGDPQQALKKLAKARRQNPRNANAFMITGLAYERIDKPERAADYYAQAVELDPKNSSALNNYGKFLCARGSNGRATKLFERAADNPLYKRGYLALTNAGICMLNAGKQGRAEDYLLRALKANKRFAPALLRMAQIRYREENYLSARGYLQRFEAVSRQTPMSAWLGLRTERELGDQDAVASYGLALKNRFPDSRQTRKLLEWERDGRI